MVNDLIAALERAAAQCEKTAAIMAKLLQGPEAQAAIDALEPSARVILDQDRADAALIRALIERMRADPDATTGCADDQIWRDVPVDTLRALIERAGWRPIESAPGGAKGDV